MKEVYVDELVNTTDGEALSLYGWVKAKRSHGGVHFLDIVDSTGVVQVVVSHQEVDEESFSTTKSVPLESAIRVNGTLQRSKGVIELHANQFIILGEATKVLSPSPRSGGLDLFASNSVDHHLSNRHLYIRDPKNVAILCYRDKLFSKVRQWFEENRFIAFDAPVLTPIPLYDESSAIELTLHDESIFLTQCVGYYLHAAAEALDRVYNLGPSFRGQEGQSPRHLTEYWHIKAELAFGTLEDAMVMVEQLLSYLSLACRTATDEVTAILGTQPDYSAELVPYPRLTYMAAVEMLRGAGRPFEFGKSLSATDERLLSAHFTTPFWIYKMPRTVEPFPYRIDPDDARFTLTADLILPNGYGELLGTAEKINTIVELDERLAEKGKIHNPRYQWLREVVLAGCSTHSAWGMGAERLIRFMLQMPHVRDAIGFPRAFGRSVYP